MHISALYESVTNSIIADLERGVASWVKPWKNGNTGGILPVNAATKRSYNGINIPILWHAQLSRRYPTASWMTYNQAVDTPQQKLTSASVETAPVTFRRSTSSLFRPKVLSKAGSIFWPPVYTNVVIMPISRLCRTDVRS